MPRTKVSSSRNSFRSRSSLVVRVEALEMRVPVSEGIGPFLTVSALAALGEQGAAVPLAPPSQVMRSDAPLSARSHPDSVHSPAGPELISSRPPTDLPWAAQPVAALPVTSLASEEADLFQALPGAPFAAGRPVGQARSSWEDQQPAALGIGSSAPTERDPTPTRFNPVDQSAPDTRPDAELLQAVATLSAENLDEQGPEITSNLHSFPVDLTYSPVFPKPERALAGQPFTYQFTAAVDANVVPITPCELGGPFWEWSVGATFSNSPAGPFAEAPGSSWSHSFSSPFGQATTVTFTTQVLAYWGLTVGVVAEYSDTCGNVWTGDGNVTLVESTFAAAPPFKMESMPNSAVAIRNEYVEQIETVEVLKDWKVRYTAPGEGATRWQVRRLGYETWQWFRNGEVLVEANPVEWTENSVGEFDVRYARGAEFNQFSASRRIKVIEPQLVQFSLTAGGQYTKAGYHVRRPHYINPAVTFAGVVSATAASPTSNKIRWGFVQNVEFLHNVTRNWDLITWRPGTPDGTTLRFPSRFSTQSTPTRKNDAPLGNQLYAGLDSYALGPDLRDDMFDTPSVPNNFAQIYRDSLIQSAMVGYDRNQHSGESWGFVTWAVVVNLETQQYTPLRQIPWTLQIDTTQDGPWLAVVGGAADPTKPIEATQSVDKFLRAVVGPLVTITAPQTHP